MFKKYENNPILKPNPANEWEEKCVLNPAVIYDDENERFVMLYRAAGNDIRFSASEAGHVRLRPILMTSLSFVIGVMPLLFAAGAGAGARLSLGAAVVFGMLLNTVVATLYIPNWYEWMQRLEERVRGKR